MPKQYFIIPDKAFTKAEKISNPTPIGRISTTLVSDTSNVGSLTAFAFGTTTDESEYNFIIQDSGNLYQTTYAWKDKTATDEDYRGNPDYRIPTEICTAFKSTSNITNCSSITGLFSQKLKKEFIYYIDESTYQDRRINVTSRTATDDETTLEIGPNTYPFTGGLPLNYTGEAVPFDAEEENCENSCIDVCQLVNGDIRLAVLNNRDIDIYHSTDGLNFTLISSGIIERFANSNKNIRPGKVRIASSGNYLRVVFVDSLDSFDYIDPIYEPYLPPHSEMPNCNYLYYATSVDGGSSWIFGNEEIVTHQTQDSLHGWYLDICGSSEEIGEFVLVYHKVLFRTYTYMQFMYASGTGDFKQMTYDRKGLSTAGDLFVKGYNTGTSAKGSPVYLCNGHEYIWAFFGDAGGPRDLSSYNLDSVSQATIMRQSHEKSIMLLDKRYSMSEPRFTFLGNNTELTDTQYMYPYNSHAWGRTSNFHTGYNGCRYFVPKAGKLYKIGSGVAFISQKAMIKYKGTGGWPHWDLAASLLSTPIYERYGNWQIRPFSIYNRDSSRLYGDIQSKAWPPTNYKDIKRGVLCWYQWDFAAGYPDPFVDDGTGAPKDESVSGGWTGYVNGVYTWSLFKTGTTGNPHYEIGTQNANALKLVANALNDRIYYWARDTALGVNHSAAAGNGTARIRGSAERCWGYWFSRGNVNMNSKGPHGVCIHACVSTNLYNPSFAGAGIRIKTYAGFSAVSTNPNSTECYATRFALVFYNGVPTGSYNGKAVFEIKDYGNGTITTRGTIEFDTTNTKPLNSNFFEIRLACQPVKGNTANKWYLSVRKKGTNVWKDFNFTPFDAAHYSTGDTSDFDNEEQSIRWGNIFSGDASGYTSSWLYFRVMHGQPMNQISYANAYSDRTFPNIVRGRILSENPVQIKDGQYISWSGYGGMKNDSFTLSPHYTYDLNNSLKYPSPRVQYRSTSGPTQELVLKAVGTTNFDSYFSHSSWAIFDTNATSVEVLGSDDNVSYTTLASSNSHIYVATVTAASGNKVTLDWKTGTFDGVNVVKPIARTLNKTRNTTYSIRVEDASPTSTFTNGKWNIKTHLDSDVYLETENSDFANSNLNSSFVGSTLYIHSPNIVLHSSTTQHYKYYKFLFSGTTGASQPENYFKIGTIVGGLSLNLDVPIKWGTDDSTRPNITQYETRSGIRWGYTEGPSQRVVNGTVTGDVSEQQRFKFRNMVDSMIDISQFPLVFVMNGEGSTNGGTISPHDIFLGELQDGVTLKNDGWYYDYENERWMPIGDMSITIKEIT